MNRLPNVGAKVSAERSRQAALDDYYKAPNHCQHCNKVIPVPDNRKVAETRLKKFCNQSCAASYANRTNPKRIAAKTSICQTCGVEVRNKRSSKGAYMKRKYCDGCVTKLRQAKRLVLTQTKAQLFATRANWQSARSTVAKHARAVIIQSGRALVCQVCNYAHHVEVCHKTSVSDFPPEATIAEINDLANLVLLCPNHHWEFDNGGLSF